MPISNTELKEAMSLGIKYAENCDADLFIATDPDCDRVGVAIKNNEGKYEIISGNEVGILLLDYICSRRTANGTMPVDSVMVKTIVTTELGAYIAEHYGIRMIDVLTGFKFIGEKIVVLESQDKANSFIFGFEESCGYLSGTHVWDKDGVNAALIICEIFAYYKRNGISLFEKLNELYKQYGHCRNTLYSYEYDGKDGMQKIDDIMTKLRSGGGRFGGLKSIKLTDYAKGVCGLPKSNVLKFEFENNTTVIIRPSGTEPKIKMYISARAKTREDAKEKEKMIVCNIEKLKD